MRDFERRKAISSDMLIVSFAILIFCVEGQVGVKNNYFDDNDIIDLDEDQWEANRSTGDVMISHSTTIIEQEAPGRGDYDPISDNEDDNDLFSGSGSGDMERPNRNISLTTTNLSNIDHVTKNMASDIPNTIQRFLSTGKIVSSHEHMDSIKLEENTNRISADWTEDPSVDIISQESHCQYSVYDTKHKKFVHENWNYTKLLLKGDTVVWCKNNDRFILFYTSLQSCQSKINLFCRARAVADQKSKRKKRKNRGDFGNGCWSNFAFGGAMPLGFPDDNGSFYYICQRFSPESNFGRVFSAEDNYFGTILDTNRRLPIMSVARVRELSDNTWPAVSDMFENALIKRDKSPWIFDWFTAKKKKGMIIQSETTGCQSEEVCRFDEFQPVTEDYQHSPYKKAYLIWPNLIGARADQRIATLTLTNTASMHPTLFHLWQNVIDRVRLYAGQRCGIPSPGTDFYNNDYSSRTDLYIISGTVPSKGRSQGQWNQMNIPDIFWMTACCVQESKIESFGIYAQNGPNTAIIPASVTELEGMLADSLRSNKTASAVKLYPAQAGVCGDINRDISYSIM